MIKILKIDYFTKAEMYIKNNIIYLIYNDESFNN